MTLHTVLYDICPVPVYSNEDRDVTLAYLHMGLVIYENNIVFWKSTCIPNPSSSVSLSFFLSLCVCVCIRQHVFISY